MGATLAQGNAAIPLLANAIATGCVLYVFITVLGPISGAHFNPAVTFARGFLDTFAGINPAHITAFMIAQLLAVCTSHFALKAFWTTSKAAL